MRECADALHAWAVLEPPASSVPDLLLPPGRSGRLRSAGRMLMISCILYLRGFRCYTCMCTRSACLHGCGFNLVISTGKFYVFVIFRCVLMCTVVSAVVSVSFQMFGTSLCSLNASDRFSSPPLLLCRVRISNIQPCTCTVAAANSSCLAGV